MKKITFLLVCVSISFFTFSQENFHDPLNHIKSFSTWDMGLYTQSPTLKNIEFGNYNLPQGIYSPTMHSAFFVHHVVKVKDEPLFKTKTGLLVNSYYTNLKNKQGEKFYLSQAEIALSFLVGTHLPMEYNNPNDKFFKAVDINLGFYMGTPWLEYFTKETKKYDGENQYFGFDYIKFGMIAEIEYSLINKEGYGHRIGLRGMTDFTSIWKFNNNETGIYPTFVSIGIYYNFWTSSVINRE